MPTALIVVAQTGYQDHELEGTARGLAAGGFELVLCSKEEGPCIGKLGTEMDATIAMRDADTADFDCIAFIGGPGAHALIEDEEALELAQRFSLRSKPIGAICIAPSLLAAAGLLQGKKATVWNEDGKQKGFIMSHGASFTGASVTVDGLLVTASGPASADEFGKTFATVASAAKR
jgi:protease I